ncbi:Charged multivesicular body protein 6 [Cyanidiococcus yangmingshanensis]|uniref:Charged multivesicular body protein 6 n=1 Tax=Cyanidiococcus yangmingshanensis TaxID=2690220 RepID=A0A7J7INW7_9RHOD|nr:Charged multivesicular body protein 6 [Cyanidiococcus yangmingshanensis]
MCVSVSSMGNCVAATGVASKRLRQPHGLENPVEITERDKVILTIKATRDRVTKLRNRYEVAAARELDVARALVASGRRERALLVLRRMKVQERAVMVAETSLGRLEEMLILIETAELQRDTLLQIKQSSTLVKHLNEQVEFSSVDDLLLESHEAAERARQIETALQGQVTPDIEAHAQRALAQLYRDQEPLVRSHGELIRHSNPIVDIEIHHRSASGHRIGSSRGVTEHSRPARHPFGLQRTPDEHVAAQDPSTETPDSHTRTSNDDRSESHVAMSFGDLTESQRTPWDCVGFIHDTNGMTLESDLESAQKTSACTAVAEPL